MFRDPLSLLSRDAQHEPTAMTAPAFGAGRAGVAIWPTGLARFDDGVLEVVGEGLRVAARDLVAVELLPALGARLQLRVEYRKGFETSQRRFWVAVADHDDLARLVARVRGALTAPAHPRAA